MTFSTYTALFAAGLFLAAFGCDLLTSLDYATSRLFELLLGPDEDRETPKRSEDPKTGDLSWGDMAPQPAEEDHEFGSPVGYNDTDWPYWVTR
jgi:hypothetical protein